MADSTISSKTIHISHLGGMDVGYKLSSYVPEKPICILVNSMYTTVDLYAEQFASKELTAAMNLLAIEPLGHGSTVGKTEHFTYWDSAAMNLQVMEALGIEKAFALGTSQGGWVVTRMALLAPERILGILPLGTSMSHESSHSRFLGCWNPAPILAPFQHKWTSASPTPDWIIDDDWCRMVVTLGFGANTTAETTNFWIQKLKSIYKGDVGRKKARMAALALVSRDGLRKRLGDVKCPVYWLHGTEDVVYSPKLAAEEIGLFTGSKEKKLEMLEDGTHYLNTSKPKEVEKAMIEMVNKYWKT